LKNAFTAIADSQPQAMLVIADRFLLAHRAEIVSFAATQRLSCSINHLKLGNKLLALAVAMANEVVTPAAAGCCGFAGDRGFLHTELTRSATAEAEEVCARKFDAYLGSNRTCEIGLNLATGRDFESFVYLLEELTRPT
jgi:D-lactate dehydrogenase